MALNAAINIGRTALSASQLGIQVTGNNMANASTPGYSRQLMRLGPLAAGRDVPQVSIGAGVQVLGIQRQVDQGLLQRIWNTGGEQAGARALLDIYAGVEAALGELGDNDLSSELTGFFNSWSERANNSKSAAAVVQQGEKLAAFMRRVRNDLSSQTGQIDAQLGALVSQANALTDQIAQINQAIADAEVSGAPANGLRDSRDQLVTQLSELVPVTVVDRGSEGFDVLVSSIPVVMGGQSRGLQLLRTPQAGGGVQVQLATISDSARLSVAGGSIGSLITNRDGVVNGVLDKLDRLGTQLIFEVNKLHSTGVNASGFRTLTAGVGMGLDDRARALNDPANTVMAQLPFRPVNGTLTLRVQSGNGNVVERNIEIDLDGITNSGAAGTSDDTTLAQIVAAIDAVEGVRATLDSEGKLRVEADEGFSFSFPQDSSGVLAAIGFNAFFTGQTAADISVRDDLRRDPTLLASAGFRRSDTSGNFERSDNLIAMGIAGLQRNGVAGLDGRSITDYWRDTVQEIGSATRQARSTADASTVVRESLENQRAAVSAVSLDEEAINLLNYQRMYQAAARIVSTADEMFQTLLSTF